MTVRTDTSYTFYSNCFFNRLLAIIAVFLYYTTQQPWCFNTVPLAFIFRVLSSCDAVYITIIAVAIIYNAYHCTTYCYMGKFYLICKHLL